MIFLVGIFLFKIEFANNTIGIIHSNNASVLKMKLAKTSVKYEVLTMVKTKVKITVFLNINPVVDVEIKNEKY